MSSQFDHLEIISDEMIGDAASSHSQERGSVYGALGRVWMLAAVVFLASGLFFLLMSGILKMLVLLAFIAFGLGVIGSIHVIAKIDIARRHRDRSVTTAWRRVLASLNCTFVLSGFVVGIAQYPGLSDAPFLGVTAGLFSALRWGCTGISFARWNFA